MVKNNKIKKYILLFLIICSVFPAIITNNFENFFNHPIQKSDIYWKQPEVNCIKNLIIEKQNIEFAWLDQNGFQKMDEYNFYLYQYMFVPIVLQEYQKETPKEIIVYFTGKDEAEIRKRFENYQVFGCNGTLFYLTLKELK